jgi:hypothetical protein
MKRYKVLFSSGALTDLQEACTWYNLQQKGLGARLITDVKNVIATVKQNPHFASIKFANIRTSACKTFPYAIHYEIDEENNLIRVVSIFHFSRRPYWLE